MDLRRSFSLLAILAALTSCAGANIFPAIEANMSNPTAVAVDGVNRLYVLNSNYQVLYSSGSIHVVDVTDPANPARVGYADVLNFSGQAYIDVPGLLLYTPVRYSDNDSDTADNLLQINIDEASANFLGQTQYPAGDDPFGITCCDAANDILVATEAGQIDYYDLDTALTHSVQSMTATLSTGGILNGSGATRIVIFGTQAVVTDSNGGIWIVNLSKLGVAGEYPVEYYMTGIRAPQGLATDGTYIYVASQELVSNAATAQLFVLDISSLTPRVGNTDALVVDASTAGILVATVSPGGNNPQEVLFSGGNAYVSLFDLDQVAVVETAGFTVTSTISVGDEPVGMAATATHLYVTNSGEGTGGNSVSIVDISGATPSVIATYP